jgi:hypothetical protein
MENAPKVQLSPETLESLVQEIEQTKALILSLGYPLTLHPQPQTLEKMKTLSLEHFQRLCFQLKVTRFLASGSPPAADPKGFHVSQIQRALDFFGLEMDLNERQKIESDDVVEIYDQFSTQLYRSLNFFKTSGYALEDLLLHEWYVLWERPGAIVNQLTEKVGLIFQGHHQALALDVPDHVLREIFHDGIDQTQHRLLQVQMKYAFPLRKKGSHRITAFAVTTRCQILFDGPAAKALKFI